MSDIYISLDDAIKAVKDIPDVYDSYYANITDAGKEYVISVLKNMKPADVEPVPEGKWKSVVVGTHIEFECTLCGSRTRGNGTEPFCPHCGRRLNSSSNR